MKPLKKFGQNYLQDKNIINKIIEIINPEENDIIIEIGPGQAALTRELLKKVKKLTAIEIDKRVIEELSLLENLDIIQGDFLELDLIEFYKNSVKKLRIVGNIPYYLTSSIIFKMIEGNSVIEDSVLMVQLEVAKRMTAKKGTKDYGILSVLLGFFCEVELCFKVSPNVFYPRPKVYSAIVHLKFKRLNYSEEFKKNFIKIVKASFGNRRKTVKNSLSNSIFKSINFSETGIDLTLRAEQLDINDFIRLTDFLLSISHPSDLSHT